MPPARALVGVAIACLLVLPLALAGHGPNEGDGETTELSDGSAKGVRLVGHTPLDGGGLNGDVWAHEGFAYVGTWRGPCPGTGVKIADIRDAKSPTFVGTVGGYAQTSAEDMVVRSVATPSFSGDLLAIGLQDCGLDGTGVRGLDLWDISDPYAPVHLAQFNVADPTTSVAPGVHELDMRQVGDRVYAYLSVPFAEADAVGARGDVRIVDVTDPRAPVQVGEFSYCAHVADPTCTLAGQGQFPYIFAHSVQASPDGQRLYASYWDAGWVIIDISNPTLPVVLGETDYAPWPEAEGNAHSMALAKDGRVLVGADEDFDARLAAVRVDAPADIAGLYTATEAAFTPTLESVGPVAAPLAYQGLGCTAPSLVSDPNAPPVTDPSGKIALVDRGECRFDEKVKNAQAKGAVAVVVVNNADGLPITMGGNTDGVSIPAVMIAKSDGATIKDAMNAGDVHMTLDASLETYNDWGYLHFFDISDPANPVRIGTFATENTLTDPVNGPPDAGDYTVHNPVVVGDKLYASWYSDGVRIVDISDPRAPSEMAYYVPPDTVDPTGTFPSKALVWGVHVTDEGLVLLSDINGGLYIVEEAPGVTKIKAKKGEAWTPAEPAESDPLVPDALRRLLAL